MVLAGVIQKRQGTSLLFTIKEQDINLSYVKDVCKANVLVIIGKNNHPNNPNYQRKINIFLIHLLQNKKNRIQESRVNRKKNQKKYNKSSFLKKYLISLRNKNAVWIEEVNRVENPIITNLIYHGVINQRVYKTQVKGESTKIGNLKNDICLI